VIGVVVASLSKDPDALLPSFIHRGHIFSTESTHKHNADHNCSMGAIQTKFKESAEKGRSKIDDQTLRWGFGFPLVVELVQAIKKERKKERKKEDGTSGYGRCGFEGR